jgi:phosphomannomutase
MLEKKIKFGTDGWRAIIGEDFNLNNVEVVAQAIADYLVHSRQCPAVHSIKVAVGYDNRRLSPQTARRIAQILSANGIKVILCPRPLPTQAISYTVRALRCTAGIMVTASHNPACFNGIKIKGTFGGPVEKEVTDKIEQLIHRHRPNKISLAQAQERGLLEITDLVKDYLKFLRSYLDMPLLKTGGLKILVDSMYGTADSYIAAILKDTPCKVTTIHHKRDVSFGAVKPEPIRSGLKEAASLIKTDGFDLGLATDGDADRIAALDAQGRFVSPQQIISLLALHLIRYRRLNGAIVKTIAGTVVLERIAKRYKLKVYETPIGFKHISALMQSRDILIGGEEAGGIGFKNYIPERDGILAGLLLLEAMLVQNKSLGALLRDMEKEFGRYFYIRKDLKCKSAGKDRVARRLKRIGSQKRFSGTRIKTVKAYDGLKLCLADESWILFRLSGTEPVLRIYAESESLDRTRGLISEGEKIVGG